MLQWWLRGLLLAELAVYMVLAYEFGRKGIGASATMFVVVAIAVAWRASHALGSFTVAALLRRRDGRRERSGTTVVALWGEFCTRLTSFNWSQPFAESVMGRDPVGKSSGAPIMLVHGYFSNRGMWVRFREQLVREGFGPIYTIDLGPPFGDIDHFAEQLATRIEDVCTETGASQITVVAHSMGGLVTRAYMAHRAAQGLPPRVNLFITLGSPHQGTQLAAFGLGRAVKQMRESSAWLDELVRQENASATRPMTVSVFTRNDDLIYPPESSELAWAENIAVDGVGHVGLLYSEPVFQIVKDQLTSKDGRFQPKTPENARQ